MTEISKAAKAKALELVPSVYLEGNQERVARFIQQVSDAAKLADQALKVDGIERADTTEDGAARKALATFILPEPVDRLVEALRASVADPEQFATRLRDNLAKHGLEVREKSDGR